MWRRPGPARRQDHGLGLDDEVLLGLEVVEDGPGTGALFVQDELDGGRELQDLDVVGVVLDLVAEGPHHLGAGDVAGIVHALPRRAAAVHGLEASVLVLGEHRPQFFQPGHDLGRLDDQRFDELGVVLEVPAAHGVQVVVIGRVLLGLGRGLDAALGHHRVGVADAELRGHEDAGPVLPGQEGRRRARATGADDEDVGLVVDVTEVDRVGVQAALGMEDLDHLLGDAVALVGADQDLRPPLFLEVGVVFEDGLALLEGHGLELDARPLLLDAGRSRFFNLFDQLFQFRRVWHGSISQIGSVLGRPGLVGHVRLGLEALVELLELVQVLFLELSKGLLEDLRPPRP